MSSSLDLKLPVNAQPTDALAFRFSAWRKIIRALNVYFKDFASLQDDIYRQNSRLVNSVNFPFFQYGTSSEASAAASAAESETSGNSPRPAYHTTGMHPEDEQTARNFLPYGSHSLADVPAALLVYHQTQAEAAHRVSKELVYNIIPRLEDLRRDLLVKIKEIKNLASDFKNSVDKEQHQAHRDLAAYLSSIDMLINNSTALSPKSDPYLLKQAVGKQLTRQVNEENYLLEAYLNIQSSGKELERVVAQEVQSALSAFGKLVGTEAINIEKLLSSKILSGYAESDPVKEWDAFISRDANFVDPTLKLRNIQDIIYPNMNSSLAYEIRSGYLERRSKYLKSYSRAWYVLTPSFLHEFKSPDRRKDPVPVMSIALSDCLVELDKKSTSGSHKFTLNTRSSRGHKWVFRAESKEKLNDWFTDLSTLSNIDSPVARALKYFPSQDPVEKPGAATTVAAAAAPVSAAPAAAAAAAAPVTAAAVAPVAVAATAFATPVPTVVAPNPEKFGAKSPRLAAVTGSRPQSSRNSQIIDDNLSPLDRSLAQPNRGGSPGAASELTPVLSNTSEVTSIGEPFGAGHTDFSHESLNQVIEEPEGDLRRKGAERGRFQSVLGGAAGATPGSPESGTNHYAIDDDSSVFSYDLKHPTNSTLPNDKNFAPVDSDLPIQLERRLTQTNHKEEAIAALHSGIGVARGPESSNVSVQEAVAKRRDSVLATTETGTSPLQRRPSRQATGSFGVDDLKPLTGIGAANDGGEPSGLFFAGGLPQTTSSGAK
ncbi:uncharacterized protein SAPINGB_P000141 [Magnusiomyces paraingens]|uniref:PH domain-containing protein n=1 Tax=Magnusiomyces paraingens TaxID=2606893 RepID=A0A5E8AYE8_9ASCO|nr:uncharacterized protein SAPINGB_P000141 [Saprochaete ingens]VVT43778.1 unnamed protein product [Saprochaete ingens]